MVVELAHMLLLYRLVCAGLTHVLTSVSPGDFFCAGSVLCDGQNTLSAQAQYLMMMMMMIGILFLRRHSTW